MKRHLKSIFGKNRAVSASIVTIPPVIEGVGQISNIRETSESYIHLPLEIDLRAVQNKLNREIQNGSVIVDLPNSINMSGGTYISNVRVHKLSDILLSDQDGKLHVTIHVKVECSVQHVGAILGSQAYDVSVDGKIKMISSLILSDNLELSPTSTQIEIEQLVDWSMKSPKGSQPQSPEDSSWYGYLMGGAQSILNYTKESATSIFSSTGKLGVRSLMNGIIIPKYLNAYIFNYIAENYCSKQAIVRRLNEACEPKEIDTDYHVWYAIQPQTIYTSEPVISGGKLRVALELHAKFEASIGKKPFLRPDQDIVKVKSQSLVPVGDFKAIVPIYMPFASITKLVRGKLCGRNITSKGIEETPVKQDLSDARRGRSRSAHIYPVNSGAPPVRSFGLDAPEVRHASVNSFSTSVRPVGLREKLTNKIAEKVVGTSYVQDVRISKGSGSLIIVGLKLKGSFNGDYKVAFYPLYDIQKEEIRFEDYKLDQGGIILDSRLDIRGTILKVADVFFHDEMLKLIKQYITIPLRPYIDEALKELNNYLKTKSPIRNVAGIEVTNFFINKINIAPAEIVAVVSLAGKATISLGPESV